MSDERKTQADGSVVGWEKNTGSPSGSDFPWKVDDRYPVSAVTPSGERLVFDDLLLEGQRVAHSSDGEGNNYGPHGRVVRRDDGLWIEAENDA